MQNHSPKAKRNDPRKQKVYVVYGHDQEARNMMKAFLEEHGLQPIEKEDVVDLTQETTPFIGDVLNAAFGHAQAVIALLTGVDEARLREQFWEDREADFEKEFWPQPGQDQIFEAGYAFGKAPKRTILVQIGDVRPFSDIAGRHILHFTGTDSDRQALRKRLKRAGCELSDTEIV